MLSFALSRAKAVKKFASRVREVGGLRPWLMYLPGPGPRAMSELRKRWVLFRNPHADIQFRGPVYLGPGFSLHMPLGGTFIVEAGVEFRRNFRAELGPQARVSIGPGCHLTHNIVISCSTSVRIGARSLIANAVYIVDGNHRFRDHSQTVIEQGYDYREIVIGEDAMILSKATIVNSVGRRGVVAANAVVTRPVPDYSLVGGVPARVLEYFGPERSSSSASTSG